MKILIILCALLCSSCSILEKLDYPDEVHERINNQENAKFYEIQNSEER